MRQSRFLKTVRGLPCVLAILGGMSMIAAEEIAPRCFDVDDRGVPGDKAPLIQPWKTVPLDPDYGGLWVVAGDVDGDGIAEIVSCENFNEGDVHYTSTAVAQKLDGTVLWRWGDPAIGRKKWHHDVACQIHDWDGDGRNEVVLCAKGAIVELDGATGKERRRIPIPDEATDCLVFCNLTGKGPRDILVKTRYTRIWAYNHEGKQLWDVSMPGHFMTAHQPRPMDIDGDGRDEVMAGYAMLNPDGSVRWVCKLQKTEQGKGHVDCARLVRQGKTPEECRIAFTCCGDNDVAMVDGTGKVLWEVTGLHFESLDVGRVVPGQPGAQIVVDIDHSPYGQSQICVFDEAGALLGRIRGDYFRHHALLDWTGDGCDEIAVAHHAGLYGQDGKRIATFAMGEPERSVDEFESSVLVGDMTGDGVPDVLVTTPTAAYIYKNEHGRKPEPPAPPGTEPNFTLY